MRKDNNNQDYRDNEVITIAMSGGPSGGKTSGISILNQRAENVGIKVYNVKEAATYFISSGIKPWEMSTMKFQEDVLAYEYMCYNMFKKAAEKSGKKSLILFDRGFLDAKAYMTESEFQELVKSKSLSETELRDAYDAVFFLKTAADGAPGGYTLDNNPARTEDREKAIELDQRTLNAWIGHSNLKIIDNSTDFNGKMDRLVKQVFSFLGYPVPLQIQRKFLIKKPCCELLSVLGCVKVVIFQTYLHSNDPLIERRVRKRGSGETFSYYYTEKSIEAGPEKMKKERKISKMEYDLFLKEGEKYLEKVRYCFVYKNQYFNLDFYPDQQKNAILEVETTKENQIVNVPSSFDVIADVTCNPKYDNRNIAK